MQDTLRALEISKRSKKELSAWTEQDFVQRRKGGGVWEKESKTPAGFLNRNDENCDGEDCPRRARQQKQVDTRSVSGWQQGSIVWGLLRWESSIMIF